MKQFGYHTWQSARWAFDHEPEFQALIDDLSPDVHFPLIEVNYRFGDTFFQNGQLYLPDGMGALQAIASPVFTKDLGSLLAYRSLPLGMVVEGSVDCYASYHNRVSSIAYYQRGLNIGIWEYFQEASPLSVMAGTHALYILPKISEAGAHERIKKKYGVKSAAPHTLSQTFQVFREILLSPAVAYPWNCKIIFFSAPWDRAIRSDPAWRKVYDFLLKRMWEHTISLKSKLYFDPIWADFLFALEREGVKTSAFLSETLKYLLFVSLGVLPAFSPATDHGALPIHAINEAYLNVYQLKKYGPSLMGPAYFDLNQKPAYVYHSLQNSSFLEAAPKNRNINNMKKELRNLIALSDYFFQYIRKQKFQWAPFENLRQVDWTYFHNEADLDSGIHSSQALAIEDPRFLYGLPEQNSPGFAERSHFVRGCVRISKK